MRGTACKGTRVGRRESAILWRTDGRSAGADLAFAEGTTIWRGAIGRRKDISASKAARQPMGAQIRAVVGGEQA